MNHRGFTLIEVIVALTVGAGIVLLVRQSFASALKASQIMADAAAESRLELSAHIRLAAVFGSLEVGTPNATFDGHAHHAEFGAIQRQGVRNRLRSIRVEAADGWLMLHRDTAMERLMPARAVAFEYLLLEGADSRWVWRWQSPSSAPIAIRMRVRRDSIRIDTLLFVVGRRG